MENSITTSRVMKSDNAFATDNIAGGAILSLIDETALIACTHYSASLFNGKNFRNFSLMYIENINFFHPIHNGDVANFCAKVKHQSENSIQIYIEVFAENQLLGDSSLTLRSVLWYSVSNNSVSIAMRQPTSDRSVCSSTAWRMFVEISLLDNELHSVENAICSYLCVVSVNDVDFNDKITAGVVLKLLTNISEACASKHCLASVTASHVDAASLHISNITKGDLLHIRARPIFSSSHSLMVQAVTLVKSQKRNSKTTKESIHETYCACNAFYTFVILSSSGEMIAVPPLKLKDVEERERFQEGKLKHFKRKKSLL